PSVCTGIRDQPPGAGNAPRRAESDALFAGPRGGRRLAAPRYGALLVKVLPRELGLEDRSVARWSFDRRGHELVDAYQFPHDDHAEPLCEADREAPAGPSLAPRLHDGARQRHDTAGHPREPPAELALRGVLRGARLWRDRDRRREDQPEPGSSSDRDHRSPVRENVHFSLLSDRPAGGASVSESSHAAGDC